MSIIRDIVVFHSDPYTPPVSTPLTTASLSSEQEMTLVIENIGSHMCSEVKYKEGCINNNEMECRVASLQDIIRYLHTLSVPSAHLPSLSSSSSYIQFLDPHAVYESMNQQHPLVGMSGLQVQLYHSVLAPYNIHPPSCTPHSSPDNISLYSIHHIRACSGIIIQGDTGCGKTSLAHWVIAQGRDIFKCISISCADLVHKIVGESEQKLRNIFQGARAHAPCFILLENIENILGSDSTQGEMGSDGIKRSQRTSHHALDRILSTMLIELDGIDPSRRAATGLSSAVIVIATTSDISTLDKSLLRPGMLVVC